MTGGTPQPAPPLVDTVGCGGVVLSDSCMGGLQATAELRLPDAIFADVCGAVAVLNDSWVCRRRTRGRSSDLDSGVLPTLAPSLFVMVAD